MTIPFDSDASRAAVTTVAQAIAAYADRHAITVTPKQCEELAETLVSHYHAFYAGLRHAAPQHQALPKASPSQGSI